ncbi:MAG: BON domain-containing protein [Dehalococcoidia bacterium]|nr:BON domain-containing protein [Dehalococcoidia bacterium]
MTATGREAASARAPSAGLLPRLFAGRNRSQAWRANGNGRGLATLQHVAAIGSARLLESRRLRKAVHDVAEVLPLRKRRTPRWRALGVPMVAGAILGGAFVYFMDPDKGTRRRHIAMDRAGALTRRSATRLGRSGRKLGSDVYGWRQKIAHRGAGQPTPPNDEALARKVESELFRDPGVPKGRINVNAEHGVVVLRGELDRPEEIKDLAERARSVPGVADVRNLLHLVNSPHRN